MENSIEGSSCINAYLTFFDFRNFNIYLLTGFVVNQFYVRFFGFRFRAVGEDYFGNNILASPKEQDNVEWNLKPFQLLTLWDIKTEIEPNFFLDVMQGLSEAESHFLKIYQADKDAMISESDSKTIETLMFVTENLCNFVGLKSFQID